MRIPIPAALRCQMEFHHGKGKAINDSIGVLGNIEAVRNNLSHVIDDKHQITPAAMKP